MPSVFWLWPKALGRSRSLDCPVREAPASVAYRPIWGGRFVFQGASVRVGSGVLKGTYRSPLCGKGATRTCEMGQATPRLPTASREVATFVPIRVEDCVFAANY